MSKVTHGIVQALLLLVQVGTMASTVVSPKYQGVVVAGVAFVQAVLAVWHHQDVAAKS